MTHFEDYRFLAEVTFNKKCILFIVMEYAVVIKR